VPQLLTVMPVLSYFRGARDIVPQLINVMPVLSDISVVLEISCLNRSRSHKCSQIFPWSSRHRASTDQGHASALRYVLSRLQLTLHPSQVKAPKWNPAAGSPHTRHSWFICKQAPTHNLIRALNALVVEKWLSHAEKIRGDIIIIINN
jgi:hypothetical protein